LGNSKLPILFFKVKFILKNNKLSDVDMSNCDNDGNTYLHALFQPPLRYIIRDPSALVAMVTSLLEKGVNPNQLNRTGNSPLHIACEKNILHAACLIAAHKRKFLVFAF
jgi:ankyrin repeat protein